MPQCSTVSASLGMVKIFAFGRNILDEEYFADLFSLARFLHLKVQQTYLTTHLSGLCPGPSLLI